MNCYRRNTISITRSVFVGVEETTAGNVSEEKLRPGLTFCLDMGECKGDETVYAKGGDAAYRRPALSYSQMAENDLSQSRSIISRRAGYWRIFNIS